ncbi:Nif11-like leader peptide family natural product precursor [Desulfobacter vibrioformis]|uniref:Nif11-like leader peptide family natural product precursor n=1 Tax=Desulfobacter vibrioformis TaxID=34031 RepID=UPI0005522434|nr:Nif11-like leader peptide family natural product precursor [Desulfobacter vibrioformis]
MSMESAREFMERIQNDKIFRDKVAACKDKESRKAFVESENLHFTNEDLLRLKAESTSNNELKSLIYKHLNNEITKEEFDKRMESVELTDQQLGDVAGGFCLDTGWEIDSCFRICVELFG